MKKTILLQISKYFDTIETIALLTFVAGTMMLLKDYENAIKVVWFGLGGLIILYWLMAVEPKTDEETIFAMVIRKLTWIAFSISLVGIVLKFEFDDKAEPALLAGFVSVIISMILTIYVSVKETKKLNIKNIVRAIIIGSICIFIYTL